jgi:hypothetical protein
MTSPPRFPLCVRVVIVAITAVAALFGLPGPHAAAFFIQNHEAITRNALPQIPNDLMAQILVGPLPGAGAVGTDAFFNEDFRHLDNSKNPSDLCARATQAWNTFDPVVLSGSRQVGADLADGPAARAAVGALLHVQQDFYAHSNWVDTQGDKMAPAIFPTCDPAAFPAGLYTGYFELGAPPPTVDNPLSGCPATGPPPGFQQCHSTLNKDGPNTQNGSQIATGTNMTKYDVAAQLATAATVPLFNQIRAQVASTNGDNAATVLFGSGGPPAATGPASAPEPVSAPGNGSSLQPPPA